ncbi:MAG: hypothetical protein A3G33_04910 [Omnitrophica bacterium RIFCSPLOWO2_12_FULL_44_17]|uniref:Uncharacterized protein n=1 Tax=Candidatus Danuiimicrobium aquiferis TaxID=1801832 RepID=A0A1G1KXL2_9BACT|nr:MAG: hypothetical protein A3E74_07850 [Omnitrophica bacterium RIFCSPHIGHO2_12_FULL_44_12]OGW97635.1 MAG: hypothetical protein A3G33_04910 [Omnitrophica bacterium RIFCSPLOWO2_12_FULL_44_17]OGX05171.1 MAG: hypothetical protein A3J12_04430 [Omnitrophica bacterium RIFCSPLOWO2_02_FULL_44_11]
MEKPLNKNNGFIAKFVTERLFGNGRTIKNIANNAGLSFGLKKAFPFASWFNFPVTVGQNWIGFVIIGSLRALMKTSTILNTVISFTTVPIFTKTDVLLAL